MKVKGFNYSIALFLICLLISKPLHAEISIEALLDLTTCYGVDFPAEKFQASIDKDPRIRSMEQTLLDIRKMSSVKLAEVDGFYTPNDETEVLGNSLQFIGLYGFGPLTGVNIVLGGSFDDIKRALQDNSGTQYTRCDGKSNLHLKVCHQDITDRYGHVIMTHPHNPQQQVILICVDKKGISS